jgi:dipeptidyl aminopeptidase/acylaminoacyl peptidase
MFFTARQQSEPGSTLYAASVSEPGTAKAVFVSETPMFLGDVSSDGATALLSLGAGADAAMVALDVASGTTRRLFPPEGTKARIRSGGFSSDGKTVYLALGGDPAKLVALEARTGKIVATHEVPGADISTVIIAPRGGRIALNVTRGSYSEIRVVDARKLALAYVVAMPPGLGAATSWSEDGKRLAAVWSTPSSPTNIYVIDGVTGQKVEPLRTGEQTRLAAIPEIAVSVVEIPAFDGGKIPANVYLRKGEEAKPHPTLVIYHGGPSVSSMVRWSVEIAFFVSLGYAIVEPNVRGSGGYGLAYEAADNGRKRLDAFKDVESSARWVAEQPWADRKRLVVTGGSYGGYTTFMALALWPDLWRAGVARGGPVNLRSWLASTTASARQFLIAEFGDPDQDADFLDSISPLTHADEIVAPTFIMVGANDPRVPRSESDQLVKVLRRRKVPVEYMVAANEGHSMSRRETQIEYYSRVARFLEGVLGAP